MIFCIYTSDYDEEFITKGKTAKEAFQNLLNIWDRKTPKEHCKFYKAVEIYPVKRSEFR